MTEENAVVLLKMLKNPLLIKFPRCSVYLYGANLVRCHYAREVFINYGQAEVLLLHESYYSGAGVIGLLWDDRVIVFGSNHRPISVLITSTLHWLFASHSIEYSLTELDKSHCYQFKLKK